MMGKSNRQGLSHNRASNTRGWYLSNQPISLSNQPIYLINLSIYLSTYLYLYQFIYLFIYLNLNLNLNLNLSIYLINLSTYLSIYLPIDLSIYLSNKLIHCTYVFWETLGFPCLCVFLLEGNISNTFLHWYQAILVFPIVGKRQPCTTKVHNYEYVGLKDYIVLYWPSVATEIVDSPIKYS